MPAARGAGAAATAGAAEVEERVRRELRSELAVRDARAKAAEQELAELIELLRREVDRHGLGHRHGGGAGRRTPGARLCVAPRHAGVARAQALGAAARRRGLPPG